MIVLHWCVASAGLSVGWVSIREVMGERGLIESRGERGEIRSAVTIITRRHSASTTSNVGWGDCY